MAKLSKELFVLTSVDEDEDEEGWTKQELLEMLAVECGYILLKTPLLIALPPQVGSEA